MYKISYPLFLILPVLTNAQNVINLPISTSNTDGSCGATVLKKAYHEIGYKLNFQLIPAQRALIEANKGNLDGVMNRIEGLDKNYSNLVKIPTPICINRYFLYMLKDNKHSFSKSQTSKQMANLKLGIKIGNTPIKNSLEKYFPYEAATYEQLIGMLINKRLDAVAMSDIAFQNVLIAYPEYSKKHIIAIDYNFSILYGYHYLNKKHVNLITPISEILSKFAKEGFIKKTNDELINYLNVDVIIKKN